MKQKHDVEWLSSDKRIRKWMVQCTACGRWGIQKDAPSKFFGRANLEEARLELMQLDAKGRCEICHHSEFLL